MKLDHVTIRTRDLQTARSFFLKVFDLEEGERPLAVQRIPGHWLYSEGHPLVHIIGAQGYGIDRAAEAIDHVGLRMEGYADFRNKLDAKLFATDNSTGQALTALFLIALVGLAMGGGSDTGSIPSSDLGGGRSPSTPPSHRPTPYYPSNPSRAVNGDLTNPKIAWK